MDALAQLLGLTGLSAGLRRQLLGVHALSSHATARRSVERASAGAPFATAKLGPCACQSASARCIAWSQSKNTHESNVHLQNAADSIAIARLYCIKCTSQLFVIHVDEGRGQCTA
eukprot:1775833-Pleurochrysis_carterae.AAC.3